MSIVKKSCAVSGTTFEITDPDQDFYQRLHVPLPTFCPEERQRRRLAFRNEMKLYQRRCDKTGTTIISMYAPDAPYKIYEPTVWHSDTWDSMEHGRPFDFSRHFFDQFAELQKVVPRMALNVLNNENSDYTNYALRNKNSYLVFTADENENCYYGRFSDRNHECVDFDFTYDSTQCYEVIDCLSCNSVYFSQLCENSYGLYFCYNLRGCHDCIFSTNLHNAEYYIFNKKVSKEEFERFKQKLKLHTFFGVQAARKKWQEFLRTQPRRATQMINCENSTGDYLKNCRNAQYCFDGFELDNVKFASHLYKTRDAYDWDYVGMNSELCYEMVSCAYGIQNCQFTMNSWNSNSGLRYCELCIGNKDLFGCIGLKKKQYCILNKQYSEEEYKQLTVKIIEHMKATGEWGEFFPAQCSPFAYNESVVYEYYPLTKEEALKRGLRWRNDDPKEYQPQTVELADDIAARSDDMTTQLLACEVTGKNYKITPQELAFYRANGLAIPRCSPEQRQRDRMQLRNPRTMYERSCERCKQKTMTTYSPNRSESIYCERCYQQEFV